MKKKVYVTPEVDAVVLLQQDMLCGSGNGMDIMMIIRMPNSCRTRTFGMIFGESFSRN